jgi:hypothetical protein
LALHVTGDRCPNCRKKGLVVGGFSILTEEQPVFRPKGWLIDRLEVEREVCPSCGFIVFALSPRSLKRLQRVLREDREKETVTYHARTRKKPSKGKPRN